MFKYLIPLLLAAPLAAQEQPFNQPFMASQPCGDFMTVAPVIQRNNEEMLFKGDVIQRHISGQIAPAKMVFTTNQDTGTWSLLALFPGNIACLVANGTNFEPYVD